VHGKLAMTGELSLRGRALPIGGLKEKLMAAYINGMKTVLIPESNLADLDKVDDVVKQSLHIIPVTHMNEVLHHALCQITPSQQRSHSPKSTRNDRPVSVPIT